MTLEDTRAKANIVNLCYWVIYGGSRMSVKLDTEDDDKRKCGCGEILRDGCANFIIRPATELVCSACYNAHYEKGE